MERLEDVQRTLNRYHQEHLLMKYDSLGDREQEKLLDSIDSIDFDLMERLYHLAQRPLQEDEVEVRPMEHVSKEKLSGFKRRSLEAIGTAAIKDGQLAVVTMAGGQGTRLGFDGPKGAFIFDPETNKSIFEVLVETMKEACLKYGVPIPWYIMTSKENNRATRQFFADHYNFGYYGDIGFFVQEELPMLDLEGKILLDSNYQIKKAANGHGGTLNSLQSRGVIAQMKTGGIKWVSIVGVDNVLVKPVDPIFLGLAISNNSQGAIKSIEKANPEERVGVICRKNGNVGVVEYTEISHEMANECDDEGCLVYGDAYALFNLYSIEGLERVAEVQLPYHVAIKKADYIDSTGKLIKADKPNAYKFEQFIFDSYEFLDNVCVFQVKRDEEFAPIKNAQGEDSPETARRLYKAYKNKKN